METRPIPQVRPLESVPVEDGSEQLVVLRDPYRFQPNAFTLSLPTYLLLTLFNGERTADEVRKAFKARYYAEVSVEEIDRFAAELDELGFLFTERFEEMRRQSLAEFQESPCRKPAHAGKAYECEPANLRKQIDGFYDAMRNKIVEQDTVTALSPASATGEVQALIVPHIDPRVGGCTSAFAFSALRTNSEPPDLFVIFGTAHQPGHSLFALTGKDFETPFGMAETDRAIIQTLRDAYPFDLEGEEYLHKHEHSIEFPLIFLQHLYPNHPFKILPILTGSFYEFLESAGLPDDDEAFAAFPRALRKALETSGQRVCFVAGADMSHIGAKFGDEEPITEELLAQARADDLAMLKLMESGNPEGFFRFLQESGDKQKVCGLPPIYTMMRSMQPGCTGRLLDYDLNLETPTQSFVTFASMGFYGQ